MDSGEGGGGGRWGEGLRTSTVIGLLEAMNKASFTQHTIVTLLVPSLLPVVTVYVISPSYPHPPILPSSHPHTPHPPILTPSHCTSR